MKISADLQTNQKNAQNPANSKVHPANEGVPCAIHKPWM
jgi:hypothetical protein